MPVLSTKLHVPSPRRQLVARPRLVDQLRTAPGAMPRLVMVAAPAGFGKTTVMTQWLAGQPSAAEQAPLVAWLSLDSSDADLREFLTHLLAALQTASPDVGSDAKALLENDRGLPVDDILVSLINDLDVLAGPTVIAFDDYHAVDNVAVHEAMTFLLDHLPPQASVALTTRADPPLPLARLRTRGELLEIRAADLRFTPEEAEAFLNEVMGLDLEPAYVAALESRTEGWAAGLQLAALSAKSHGSGGVGEFVDAFAGSHRFVLDYLVEEVLDSQPEDVRTFLLDTSVLDELTGPLCDALTGREDGQDLLETLVRANLFVVPLDDGRRWYRYHHLFADALRARLAALHADRVGELHAAASRWLAETGLLADAVRHAIASGDHEHTADLVELTLADLRRRRQDRILRDWLVTLPDDVVRRRPLLATFMGWRRLSEGDFDGVEAWLAAAEAGLDTTPPPTIPADHRFAGPPLPLVVHIVGATTYALVGILQFVPRFRRRHLAWHRRAGRVLAVAGLLVAISALWMTLFYEAQPGTGDLLYVLRLVFGSAMAACIVLGFTTVRRRDIAAHRAWMIRAYAIGSAAGTQAFTEGIGGAIFGTSMLAADLAKGAGWVINLAVAEWALRRPARRRSLRPAATPDPVGATS